MRYRQRRRGVSFVETLVAMALLAVGMTVFLQYTVQLARHRRAADAYHAALREADNLMERLGRLSWEALTAEAAGEEAARSEDRLAGAAVTVDIAEVTGPPPARQLTVRITVDAPGAAPRTVRLDGWRFLVEGNVGGE